MSDIDLDQARRRLLAEQERLRAQLAEVRGEREEDGPIDALSGEAGQDTTRVAAQEGIEAGLERSLTEVAAALQRVEDGTYGYDEQTGEPIDPARLEALPTARTNIR
jgi:RNA polymerase-binding transcription factor DksA